MIRIQNLCKSYGGKPVLRQYSLTVQGPLVLMGPSGCGKTTLLRCLMGLERPDSGTITGVGKLAAVFQEDRLCPQLNAVDNICLTGNGLRREDAKRELCNLGFTADDLCKPARKLSGGQKRRVALLRALLCEGAQTLLFDEPTTGMDAALVVAAAAVTARLTGKRDAIFVTHDEEAARILGWPMVQMDN